VTQAIFVVFECEILGKWVQ